MVDFASLENSLIFVETWYRNNYPHSIKSAQFKQFVSKMSEIARTISNIKVRIDSKSSLPYMADGICYLPASFFLEETYEKLGVTSSIDIALTAIGTLNGFTCHEALHHRLSDKTLTESALRIKVDEEWHRKSKIFLQLINAVEDIYIEAWARHFASVHSNFIEIPSILHFTEKYVNQIVMLLESGNPEMMVQGQMGLMGALKNTILFDHEILGDLDIVQIARQALDVRLDKEGRVEIAYEIFKKMLEDFESEMQAQGGEGDEKQEGEGEKGKTKGENPFKNTGEMKDHFDAEEANASDDEKDKSDTSKENGEDGDEGDSSKSLKEASEEIILIYKDHLEEIQKSLNEEIEKSEKMEVREHKIDMTPIGEMLGRIRPIVFNDVAKFNPKRDAQIVENREFAVIGNFLRYVRQTKTTTGAPLNNGSRLVKNRLWRIATDNKVMSNPHVDKVKKGKPEVIILLDISGSTGGYHIEHNGRKTLFIEVCEAGKGAFISLMQAGIPVAVYAHTTILQNGSDSNNPHVIGVASFNMPLMSDYLMTTPDYAERFNKLCAIDNGSNYDGIAIDHVAKRFTNNADTKVLWHLSDGQPAGHSYNGQLACKHVTETCEHHRKLGVKVFSMSVQSGVMSANNSIYGAKFNIAAFGANLEREVQRMVREIGES